MKVGDYVRFDYHRVSTPIQIAKITETHYDNEDDSICYSTDIDLVIDESNLVKEPSPNIIDLIEENDLVRIEYYAPSYEERIIRIFVVDFKNENDIAFENSHCNLNIFDNEWSKHDIKLNPVIKGIITHEQIESMEYKVKE